MPGERDEQQPFLRQDAFQVRQTPQDVAARRLAFGRLIRREQGDLIFAEACVTHERIFQRLRIVRCAAERRDLRVVVAIHTDDQGKALWPRRPSDRRLLLLRHLARDAAPFVRRGRRRRRLRVGNLR